MLSGFRLAALIPLFVNIALPLLAQDARGTIGGRVADAQNALVVGAHITATNQATGLTEAAVTNEYGSFRLPFLAAGRYRVAVEMAAHGRGRALVLATPYTSIPDMASKISWVSEWFLP